MKKILLVVVLVVLLLCLVGCGGSALSDEQMDDIGLYADDILYQMQELQYTIEDYYDKDDKMPPSEIKNKLDEILEGIEDLKRIAGGN